MPNGDFLCVSWNNEYQDGIQQDENMAGTDWLFDGRGSIQKLKTSFHVLRVMA
jgi:hypothetical protein